jgi:site-specific DNA-methyltransferase (adenine-specific)
VKPYYEHGGITIYHGDAREIVPCLPRVDLVLTDPPYAIGAGRGEWSATAAVAIALNEAAQRVRKDGALIAFTTTSGRGIEFTQGAIGKRLPFNRMLIWHKAGGRSRAMSPWAWDTVAIMLFGRAPKGADGQSSIYLTPPFRGESGHPAELPDGLAAWLYDPFDGELPRESIVLDPFMGTGRLLEPAVRLGQKVIGIEIEERYCEIAAKRLAHEER